MQKLVVSLAIMFAMLAPATSFAQTQKELNQQVAEAIAGKLSDKFSEYTIHVRYNCGVAVLIGELYSPEQVNEAMMYVESLPGVTKVVNNMKVVQQQTQIQAMPVSPRLGGSIQSAVPSVPVQESVTQTVVTEQSTPGNAITQVSGQMRGVTDFSQQPRPAMLPAAPATVSAPIASAVSAPVAPAPTFAPVPTQPTVQVAYVESPQGPTDFEAPISGAVPMPANVPAPQYAAPPTSISTQGVAQYQTTANFGGMPLPMSHQVPTAGRLDQPNVPNHAWPAYAAPNNYSEVAYPRLYCPQAAPYIGPFYPYPQVPMGWRKVTLEWHDGYWWLDFDDGTANGPFSPLFRQPNPKRY